MMLFCAICGAALSSYCIGAPLVGCEHTGRRVLTVHELQAAAHPAVEATLPEPPLVIKAQPMQIVELQGGAGITADKARRAGDWDIQASQGSGVPTMGKGAGTVVHSVVVRFRHRYGQRAVGVWQDGKFDVAYTWHTSVGGSLEAVGAMALRAVVGTG